MKDYVYLLYHLGSYVAHFCRSGCIVELGVGNSTSALRKVAKEHNRKLYSVDSSNRKCKDQEEESDYENHVILNTRSSEFIKHLTIHPVSCF